MAEELIIDKRKIEAYEQLAGCQAYTNYLTRLAVYGSDAEIVTALLIDLPVWGANCSKISLCRHIFNYQRYRFFHETLHE